MTKTNLKACIQIKIEKIILIYKLLYDDKKYADKRMKIIPNIFIKRIKTYFELIITKSSLSSIKIKRKI